MREEIAVLTPLVFGAEANENGLVRDSKRVRQYRIFQQFFLGGNGNFGNPYQIKIWLFFPIPGCRCGNTHEARKLYFEQAYMFHFSAIDTGFQ